MSVSEGTIEALLKICKSYLPADDVAQIERVYAFAQQSHASQTRDSGQPYISHPVMVATILAELHQDGPTVCAGLLHDVLEDTSVTEADLTKAFGADICQLVEGVTKLGKIYFGSKEEQQAENFRKLFLAIAHDVRVVIIKLADRLHNMRTLKFLPAHKRQRVAIETREIFAPLAHRMGMWSLKWELEDLAFFHLEPDEFQEIKQLVAMHRTSREQFIAQFISHVEGLLKESHVEAFVSGRPKHFYSISEKLKKQKIDFDDLYDSLAIRVMVKTIPDCYQVLGIMHAAFKPISGRIKDYIAVPKSNLYQSLHTTVIGPEGKPVEIQIRTQEMHQIAENGIAAHWRYKEGTQTTATDFTWLRDMVDGQKDAQTPRDFLHELKLDLFIDEVFLFTPLGDLYVLPAGSTPVDFAYRIHSEIGHRCTGAKVNGAIATLDHVLQSGDRIEILTSKQGHPKLDWLDFVKTSQAKNRIKQWFRKQRHSENMLLGRQKVEKALLVGGFSPKEILTSAYLDRFKDRFPIETFDDLYLQVAHGDVRSRDIVTLLHKPEEDKAALPPVVTKPSKSKRSDDLGIRVLGEDNISVRIAKCCHPLPGDDIIGFITLGSGVSVHRRDCRHLRYGIDDSTKARLIDVSWDIQKDLVYPVTLSVEGFDRPGILQDILQKITDHKVAIRKVDTRMMADGGGMISVIGIDIPNLSHLTRITTAISGVQDVISVRRVNHD